MDQRQKKSYWRLSYLSFIDAKMNRFGVDGSGSKAPYGENLLTSEIINATSTMTTTTVSSITRVLSTATSALLADNEIQNGDGETDELSSRFSRPLLTIAATATILIMIAGIFGNLLTIYALIRCPKVRNVAADFIISLCAADCLFCVLVLPFMAVRYIHGAWTHGEFLCTLVPFIQYGNVGVSLLCIAMITMNRYIMIAHNSIYQRVYKKVYVYTMIIFCWIFSYGFQLPTLFGVWGMFGYDDKLETCSILPDSQGRSSKTALFIIAFIIPCVIIIACYARIFWVVHESESRMRRHASSQPSLQNNNQRTMTQIPGSINNNLNETDIKSGNRLQQAKSTRLKDQREAKQKRNEWRITKMVLAIFLSFLACYLPITIIKIADKDVQWPGLHIFGYIMIYLSACINNFIYFIMNKQYRQAYKTVLMCRTPKLLSFGHGASSNGDTPRHLANAIADSKEEPSDSC
ncbi:G-protein coupled receptor moody isoform X3 [Chironomus tepperi]|uniref:G-protein coupled receptor moody isoform X3 n=1 Tax=Chironomus tepperi TaxID=113505 RepID=UPI00391F964D